MATPVKQRRAEAAPAPPVRRFASARATSWSSAGATARFISRRRMRSRPTRRSSPSGSSIGPRPRPRTYLAQRDAAGNGARSATARRSRQSAASARRTARPLARAAARDPLRQRHRARASGACRDVCRHPLRAVSPAYCSISNDFGKLRYIFDLLTPGLVFAADGAAYRRAIEAVVPPRRWRSSSRAIRCRAGHRRCSRACSRRRRRRMPRRRMPRSGPTPSPSSCSPRARPAPKAVINTQRMWCSNQAMILSSSPSSPTSRR